MNNALFQTTVPAQRRVKPSALFSVSSSTVTNGDGCRDEMLRQI